MGPWEVRVTETFGRMITGNWGRRGKGINKGICLVDKIVSLQDDKNSGDRYRGDNLYNNVYLKLVNDNKYSYAYFTIIKISNVSI